MPTEKDCVVKTRIIGKPRWHWLVDDARDFWTTNRSRAKRYDVVEAAKLLQKFRERPNTEVCIEKAVLTRETP